MDGGSELLETGGGEFRARFEAAFHHYSRTGGGWRVEERGGIRHRLGTTAAARVADPDHPQRPITWLLERSEDPSGNADRLHVGDRRRDAVPGPRALRDLHRAARLRAARGRATQRPRRLRADDAPALRARGGRRDDPRAASARSGRGRSSYGEAPLTGVSLLESVQLRSHGSSRPDVVRRPQRFRYALPEPETWHARFMESEPLGAPPPLTDPDARLAALDGHALPGVVQVRDGRFTYWPNAGDGRWGGPVRLRDTPIVASLAETGSQLLDLDGDTQVDLLVGTAGGAPPGYYANGEGDGWDGFVAYPRGRPGTPPFEGGRTRLADLDGDGRVDALYGGSGVYARWRNEGREGWTLAGAARLGDGEAAPDAFLGDPLVRTADMTGDGLPDLVRLRSGSVEYWPNLGNGRFGARVRMTAGPRFERGTAPEQIVLVDVDGDGCADVVTVGAAGVRVHFNRSGNGFAPPVEDPLVPPPIAGTVQAADLLGHGRPGLTWAAPRGKGTGQVALRVRRGPPLRPDRRRERRGPRVRDRVPVVRRGRAARPAGGGALDHVPAVPGPRGGRDARARRALRSRQRDPLPLPRGPLRRGRAPLRRVPARRPAGDRRRREAGRADRPSLPHRGGARAGRRARGVGTEPHAASRRGLRCRTPICRCGSRRPSTRSRSWTSCPTAGAACGSRSRARSSGTSSAPATSGSRSARTSTGRTGT